MVVNYNKLMLDIMKDFNKGRRCKTKYMIDNSDDAFVYVCIDGYYILSVPRCLWILDTEKILDKGACNDHNHSFRSINVTQLIKNTFTGEKKLIFENYKMLKDKRKVAVFGAEDLELIIDERLFKYIDLDLYDIPADVSISGTTEKAPLYIHENYYFSACLLPIIIAQ